MEISLVMKNQKISDIGYQCKSCIYCQASASLLSKLSVNKSLIKINELIEFGFNRIIFGLPSADADTVLPLVEKLAAFAHDY